jgi:hypothetical protein
MPRPSCEANSAADAVWRSESPNGGELHRLAFVGLDAAFVEPLDPQDPHAGRRSTPGALDSRAAECVPALDRPVGGLWATPTNAWRYVQS